MPIVHFRQRAQAPGPDGQLVDLPAADALVQRGPRLWVAISLPDHLAAQTVQAGTPLPGPIGGWAMLDTGAKNTSIDDDAAQQLALPVVAQTTLTSATHAGIMCNQYPVRIQIADHALEAEGAMGMALATMDLLLVLGRDILRSGTVFYNGRTGEVTWSLH